MQAACNRTKGKHPFDSDASSMGAQAHTSCNRRAGYYVREAAPPLAPVPRLLYCGTSAATRGDPTHGPTVPTEHIDHRSVSRGRRRGGQYGQKWARSNGGDRRAEAAVESSAGSRPLLGQQESPLPWREDDAPVFRSSNGSHTHNGCPANHTSHRINSAAGQAALWQAKQATLTSAIMTASKEVRHVVRFSILFLFLFLSLATGTGKGYTPKGILLHEGSGPRAPLLIRGSKAGPSEGFDSCLRALGLRAHHWSEVRMLAPRMGSTAASGHSGSAPTTDQGFVSWPPKGSTAALEHVERGMTLGTSDTWPRLGLCSRGTLEHFRDQQERFCNGIPSEGGIEPSDPIKWDRVRQITCWYFWSAPLGH
jgi:hypothetical protein